ncbi:MAG: phosphodiester glycosidase family protein [Synergistaceae bacterium]|nr:phosphodiester glycosidase family protein [Synergistaceae bacterium]
MRGFFIVKDKGKFFRRTLVLAILLCVLRVGTAYSVTKAEFLGSLLKARGIDWSGTYEYDNSSPVAFTLRTGIVTDQVGDLKKNVTRREALRWCIQSLGLSFEAGIFSDYPTGFEDDSKLNSFERGCLVVATNMNPAIFTKAKSFNGQNALSSKEAQIILDRVKDASRNLTFDMVRNPLEGLRVFVHREGVFTGVPAWRFYADGIKTRPAADTFKKFLKDEGFEVSVFSSEGVYGVRTQKLESYHDVRKLMSIAKSRGLTFRILPSMSNTNTQIVPKFWVTLVIDPSHWRIYPLISKNSTKDLLKLSELSRQYGARASINAGFFAVTSPGRGYPIGALKINGKSISEPHDGRGCLAWNDDDEAIFQVASEEVEEWDDMTNIIQAGPLLLDEGVASSVPEDFQSSLTSVRHPRSAVGLNTGGEWVFVLVDGRNGMHASGATISELTNILRAQGIVYALNLDGGGSSEIIINGKVYNSPSEGRERRISYALGVLPR